MKMKTDDNRPKKNYTFIFLSVVLLLLVGSFDWPQYQKDDANTGFIDTTFPGYFDGVEIHLKRFCRR